MKMSKFLKKYWLLKNLSRNIRQAKIFIFCNHAKKIMVEFNLVYGLDSIKTTEKVLFPCKHLQVIKWSPIQQLKRKKMTNSEEKSQKHAFQHILLQIFAPGFWLFLIVYIIEFHFILFDCLPFAIRFANYLKI